MTAYGRASCTTSHGKWVVELHSVNRKQLDISIQLPRDWLSFDRDIRSWIAGKIERGQLTVRVYVPQEELIAESFERLQKLKKDWEKLAKKLGFDPKEAITLRFLTDRLEKAAAPGVLPHSDQLRKIIKKLVEEALDEFIKMKQKEGKALASDIKKRLAEIEEDVKKIEKRALETLARYRGAEGSAEALDIAEECVRLFSHLNQFNERLKLKEKSVGRSLDFLTQEMHREINTISAKSADSEIAHLTIQVKTAVEKIREQVQNIE